LLMNRRPVRPRAPPARPAGGLRPPRVARGATRLPRPI